MTSIDDCLNALQSVLGVSEKEIPLHSPRFGGNEWEYVKSCIDSGWVSSVGEYVSLFETKIAEYTGIPYVVAVVNGTAALHVALILAGVEKEDEVLLPSLTFVATANAVMYCNAMPHFVDCDVTNFGIDVNKLRLYLEDLAYMKNNECINKKTNKRIKAIIPVHIFGHPVDMDELKIVSDEFNIQIIEDASESLGSYYKGEHTGAIGQLACLSFNGNKLITTGGGGAILTKNEDLAKKAKHLTTTAKISHRWEFYHDSVAYNYRLPNINAALGCAQLEHVPLYVKSKRQLAVKYQEAFMAVDGVTLFRELDYARSNYWLNALILEEPNQAFINELIDKAHQIGYGLRGLWVPLDKLPMYQYCQKMDLSTTHRLYQSVVSLPSSMNIMLSSVHK